jgi:hypothetical protein
LTAEWGSPPREHAFNEIWRFCASAAQWQVVAPFSQPRIYCATVAFHDRIWVLGGDIITAGGLRMTTRLVETFNPGTGLVEIGPELPFAQPAPLALVAQGRLYVMGHSERTAPGRMDSIGLGENHWRREPDGPPQMWALAGAAYGGRLYVCVPQTGLVRFDPKSARWGILGGPTRPRSPQVAAWRDEIWIMGGRDIADGSETQVYHPDSNTWRTGPALPRKLAWGAAAEMGDRLLVTGGAWETGYSDQTFVLQS